MAVASREVVKEKPCASPASAAEARGNAYVGEGDAAMVEGNPEQAIEAYERAVKADPCLADRKEFKKKVSRARAVQTYQAGRREADQGEWESAVLLLIESVGHDPTFEPARQTLELARKQAAAAHFQKATAMPAETGGLAAMAELRKALNYDPDNAESKALLDALTRQAVREIGGEAGPAPGTADASAAAGPGTSTTAPTE
jgi:tetratricopeptide (TPR) repeat protein